MDLSRITEIGELGEFTFSRAYLNCERLEVLERFMESPLFNDTTYFHLPFVITFNGTNGETACIIPELFIGDQIRVLHLCTATFNDTELLTMDDSRGGKLGELLSAYVNKICLHDANSNLPIRMVRRLVHLETLKLIEFLNGVLSYPVLHTGWYFRKIISFFPDVPDKQIIKQLVDIDEVGWTPDSHHMFSVSARRTARAIYMVWFLDDNSIGKLPPELIILICSWSCSLEKC